MAKLCFGIPVIWQLCHLHICVLEKLLCGTPRYLAYLLSGKTDVGLVCYLANGQICCPLSGKSDISQICDVAYLLPAKYVAGQSAHGKSSYIVNLDIRRARSLAEKSQGQGTTGKRDKLYPSSVVVVVVEVVVVVIVVVVVVVVVVARRDRRRRHRPSSS